MRRLISAALGVSLALGCGPEAPAEPEAPGVLEYETSSTRVYRLGRRVDVFYSGFEGEELHACGMLSERARVDLEETFAGLDPAGEYGCGPEDHDADCYPEVLIHLEGFEHSPFACDFPVTIVGVPLCEPLCCRPGLERIPSIYWMVTSYFTDGFTDPFEVNGEPYVAIEPYEPCP